MTEAQWLAATAPAPILGFLRGKASDRKRRLFGCACCRRVWDQIRLPSCLLAVETAERAADGVCDPRELGDVFDTAQADTDDLGYSPRSCLKDRAACYAATWSASDLAPDAAIDAAGGTARAGGSGADPDPVEMAEQCKLLRDIFGNPFRPVAADPGWRTSTVLSLAEGIYTDRAFDRLPILADALQDAGCENPGILNHCRSSGPHVRGCWVVDLVLGKT